MCNVTKKYPCIKMHHTCHDFNFLNTKSSLKFKYTLLRSEAVYLYHLHLLGHFPFPPPPHLFIPSSLWSANLGSRVCVFMRERERERERMTIIKERKKFFSFLKKIDNHLSHLLPTPSTFAMWLLPLLLYSNCLPSSFSPESLYS
jgi:hypothetical protein